MAIAGRATPEGTRRFAARHPDLAAGHWRDALGLRLSSIGLGTYLGNPDPVTDRAYEQAAEAAVSLGCNVIDTAINYRFQRSERSIAGAIARMCAAGAVSRDEIFVCTKGGFIPFDGGPPRDPGSYFLETFVRPGVAGPDDVVAGCHCMTPKYLRHQMEASLKNLGLETIDLYYLHNPETQLDGVDRAEFARRLAAAFEALEKAAKEGLIQWYGTATWDAYRVEHRAYNSLSLADVLQVARRVGGERNRFRAIQLPLNMAMLEGYLAPTQLAANQAMAAVPAASMNGLAVFTSAPLLQARLLRSLPPHVREHFSGLETDAQRLVQFVRSIPGVCASLVGMSRVEHVRENLAVAKVSPLPEDTLRALLKLES
jgi:aryl-alcohol dehydrogenase-like predicted oxidoreductase